MGQIRRQINGQFRVEFSGHIRGRIRKITGLDMQVDIKRTAAADPGPKQRKYLAHFIPAALAIHISPFLISCSLLEGGTVVLHRFDDDAGELEFNQTSSGSPRLLRMKL